MDSIQLNQTEIPSIGEVIEELTAGSEEKKTYFRKILDDVKSKAKGRDSREYHEYAPEEPLKDLCRFLLKLNSFVDDEVELSSEEIWNPKREIASMREEMALREFDGIAEALLNDVDVAGRMRKLVALINKYFVHFYIESFGSSFSTEEYRQSISFALPDVMQERVLDVCLKAIQDSSSDDRFAEGDLGTYFEVFKWWQSVSNFLVGVEKSPAVVSKFDEVVEIVKTNHDLITADSISAYLELEYAKIREKKELRDERVADKLEDLRRNTRTQVIRLLSDLPGLEPGKVFEGFIDDDFPLDDFVRTAATIIADYDEGRGTVKASELGVRHDPQEAVNDYEKRYNEWIQRIK